uniref:Uncharacterized protein n=1 Tax=Chenopodium quinoa TaxID=63459 RepID=A0A803MJ02_CHEQI
MMAKERYCLATGYFSMGTLPSTMKPARLPARIGACRISKLLASKHLIFSSRTDHSVTGLCCIYHNKRTGCKCQRSQRIYPVKRKFYHPFTMALY